MFHKFVKDR